MTRQEYTTMIRILDWDEDEIPFKTFSQKWALRIEARIMSRYLRKHPHEAHKPYKMNKLQKWVHKNIIGIVDYPIKVE